MKLAASNIAWPKEQDDTVLHFMAEHGFTGLEIAPTRVFQEHPYEDLVRAEAYSRMIYEQYGLRVCSMQSIWYGQTGQIFGSEQERQNLAIYTKKAIDFAEAVGCGNLVFGCPRNRVIPPDGDLLIAIRFFRELGDYAAKHHTILAMEANPRIYNTNFLNTTNDAIDFIESVKSDGFLLNLDIGTMIENDESLEVLNGKEKLINHVHISEPGLKQIKKRIFHNQLAEMLHQTYYDRFVSIELDCQKDIAALFEMMTYMEEIFICGKT